MPFIKHFFPAAKIVPIVTSNGSTRADWDRALAAVAPLLGPVLVVQSTDYSHYLPLGTAIHRDQETLNVLAAGDPAAIVGLVQVTHTDSKASQYMQMRLQSGLLASHATVIGSRNSAAYGGAALSTTSYIVSVYTQTPEEGTQLRYDDQQVVYFGGDTFLGRLMNAPLSKAAVVEAVVAEVHKLTGGAPLIVNLEGALLHEPPEKIPDNVLVAHARLAVPILKAMNVQAASLANNHSYDLGRLAYRETISILEQSGIRPLLHNSVADLGGFRVIALNFVPGSHPDGPLVSPEALSELCRTDARPPLIAFVHWGEEYVATSAPAEYAAAAALQACGNGAVVGAHSHRASTRIEALQGGEYLMVFSLGNLLFDQRSPRSSGALLELRVFEQGTYATRLVPAPNLYELALARQAAIASVDEAARHPE